MISLEQVQLLEAKVTKAIEFVQQKSLENAALISEKENLQKKLEANQRRIDELEVHVMRFKEEQGRIEDGIIAALDRLSQFEEAFESSLKEKTAVKKTPVKTRERAADAAPKTVFFEIPKEDVQEKEELLPDEDLSLERELDIF
ncbi:MAG: hypothetical protein FWC19_00785 [Treponema sp.]|nr:hypothetical protein [Treponema sp.]MCL2271327.1 hypothetical protein [Treponema sp.]